MNWKDKFFKQETPPKPEPRPQEDGAFSEYFEKRQIETARPEDRKQ